MEFVSDPHDAIFTLRSGEQLQPLSLCRIFGYPACILEDGGNSGKPVVPFCTYASTYRDETLARIVELTPDAGHLAGEGLTSGRINEQNISSWLKEIGIIK